MTSSLSCAGMACPTTLGIVMQAGWILGIQLHFRIRMTMGIRVFSAKESGLLFLVGTDWLFCPFF